MGRAKPIHPPPSREISKPPGGTQTPKTDDVRKAKKDKKNLKMELSTAKVMPRNTLRWWPLSRPIGIRQGLPTIPNACLCLTRP